LSPPPADLRVCAATRGTQVLTDGTTQSAATTLSRVTSRLVAVGMLGAAVASSAALPSTATDRASAAGQFCSSRVRGDFDGDGRADVARVGSARKGCDSRWTVVVRLGAGRSVARSLDRDRAQLEARRLCQGVKCRAFGAHDLDRDGRDELEVADETPATGDAVVVYGLAHGWLRPLKRLRRGARERELITFFYLGSANGGAWVVCRERAQGRIVVQVNELYATPSHRRAEISETTYALNGGVFRFLTTRSYSRRSNRLWSPRPVPGRRC
jgi:hypothetical protein